MQSLLIGSRPCWVEEEEVAGRGMPCRICLVVDNRPGCFCDQLNLSSSAKELDSLKWDPWRDCLPGNVH